MSGGRFQGSGGLWKSSWRGQTPYTEMCCFADFNFDIAGQFYESPLGLLPIVPAAGFFMGIVVGLSEMPGGTEPLVQNGNVANEGYRVDIVPIDATNFNFVFTVFDGAGAAAVATAPGTIEGLSQGFVDRVLFRLFLAFIPPDGGNPDGQILAVSDTGGSAGLAPLSAPYVNTAPQLRVGRVTGSALLAPSCIHGIVAGTAPWAALGNVLGVAGLWRDQVELEYQIVEVPDSDPPVPIVNTNGWRANNPVLGPVAPSPLLPFVGAASLVYGNAGPLARSLDVICQQPSLFQETLGQFPYA